MKSTFDLSQKDYIRLNLKNVKDLPDMLVSKAFELFNIKVKDLEISVRYDDSVSNNHGCPLDGEINWGGRKKGVTRSYPGWIGNIKANVNATESLVMSRFFSAGEILFNNWSGREGFRGFHTGSGCPGCSLGKYNIDIQFYFFLSDFPMLQKAKILDSFKVGV